MVDGQRIKKKHSSTKIPILEEIVLDNNDSINKTLQLQHIITPKAIYVDKNENIFKSNERQIAIPSDKFNTKLANDKIAEDLNDFMNDGDIELPDVYRTLDEVVETLSSNILEELNKCDTPIIMIHFTRDKIWDKIMSVPEFHNIKRFDPVSLAQENEINRIIIEIKDSKINESSAESNLFLDASIDDDNCSDSDDGDEKIVAQRCVMKLVKDKDFVMDRSKTINYRIKLPGDRVERILELKPLSKFTEVITKIKTKLGFTGEIEKVFIIICIILTLFSDCRPE